MVHQTEDSPRPVDKIESEFTPAQLAKIESDLSFWMAYGARWELIQAKLGEENSALN